MNEALVSILFFIFILFFVIIYPLYSYLKDKSIKKVYTATYSKILLILAPCWMMFTLAGTKAYSGRNIDDFILWNIPSVAIILFVIVFKTYQEKKEL